MEERLLDAMLPGRSTATRSPWEALLDHTGHTATPDEMPQPESGSNRQAQREDLRRRLRAGELEDLLVEIEITERSVPMFDMLAGAGMGDLGTSMQEMMESFLPKQRKRRREPVSQARKLLLQEEIDNLLDTEEIAQLAVERTEQMGIVFIDEIDKIAGGQGHGPDVSREGVQRDILPIVEGSTVLTKYGPVRTDYILFIAAGAFHVSKPADLIPELQGRFPVRLSWIV